MGAFCLFCTAVLRILASVQLLCRTGISKWSKSAHRTQAVMDTCTCSIYTFSLPVSQEHEKRLKFISYKWSTRNHERQIGLYDPFLLLIIALRLESELVVTYYSQQILSWDRLFNRPTENSSLLFQTLLNRNDTGYSVIFEINTQSTSNFTCRT